MTARAAAALAALLAVALLPLACGGDDAPEAGPRPPYPPRAAEPAASPPQAGEPTGRVVRVGAGPEGVAFDPETGLVAVGLRDPDLLALVDGATGEVRRRVPLPAAPRHLTLAGPGGPVLVPAEEADALAVVALPDGEAEVVRVGDHPHDADALAGAYYVGDEFGSTLSVVRDGRLRAQAPVDVQPGGVVAVRDAVGVVSVRAYTLELLDPGDLRGQGSQSAGLGPTHAVADAEGRVYVADTRGDALIVFETRPRLRWIARVPLPGSPYGMAADPRRGRVWVTLTARNEVAEVVAGDAPRRGRTLPTVRQPNTLAVDPASGRLFVASRTDGTLQLIDP
jgi:DNA-binding beta-propeller fold protein YncE